MKKINVNIGGKGQANIGNIVQGENVNVRSGDIHLGGSSDAIVIELLKVVQEAADGDNKRAQSVEGKIRELGKLLTGEPQNTGKIQKILDVIKKHHDWAFPSIAAVVKRLVPTLASLL